MALTSPGVEVSVIDESFYTPAEPGTTPIIFVATGKDKLNGAGTGVAPGTTTANKDKVYLMTSQRELVETFGDPTFYTDSNNNPIHGGEQNEYGLQAAYSYLGVSNRAFVVRADVDLTQLTASATPTTDAPADGTYWLDTGVSKFGVFEWDGSALSSSNTTGQSFSNKTPLVITSTTQTASSTPYAPKGSVGAVGDYAIVTVSSVVRSWYKNSDGTWVQVGSSDWKNSWATVTGTTSNPTFTQSSDNFVITIPTAGGSPFTITATTGTTLANYVTDINTALSSTGVSVKAVNSRLVFFNNGTTSDSFTLADGTGTPLADAGITAGTYYAPKLQSSAHTSVPAYKSSDSNTRPTGSVWVKTTNPNSGAAWSIKAWNAGTSIWDTRAAPIYATNHAAINALDSSGGGANIAAGSIYIQVNASEATTNLADYTVYYKVAGGATTITSNAVASQLSSGAVAFSMQESKAASATLDTVKTVSITVAGNSTDAETIANGINAAGFTNITASVDSSNRVTISHKLGGEIRFVDTNDVLTLIGFAAYNYTSKAGTANLYSVPGTTTATNPEQKVASLWKELTYTASSSAPTALAANGALWYSSVVDEVDLMVHNGSEWVGLLYNGASGNSSTASQFYNATPANAPDPEGPIVSATEPVNGDRSDGNNLVTGDIWISTASVESYPVIYRYNATLTKWELLDASDQTTENGVLFADARWSTGGGTATAHTAGTIAALLASDYVDPDCPDPALYPKGMLLWNLRRSGFNVKKFVRNSIDLTANNTRFDSGSMSAYYPHRWVTESANNTDGSGAFGRQAQRKVVVQAIQSTVNSNQDIRDDESRIFNLIAAPGYPELIGEMTSLNYDRGLTAFVVGDTPMRLKSDATSLNNWAKNVGLATEDNDTGLVTSDEYLGVYYPSGFTSDNAGKNVVVPASHMALRTIALNDQVAFPWFAPAGTRRGGVTNASSTGFISSEGEFVSIALNEGQRDTLYSSNVNPITFLTGAGLVVFGQKTRAANASALDRINVARLVVYLRSQLNQLAKPYLFEPNDKITRDEIKQQVEALLVELVGLRALYDFLVVCDESNNTPARIDRNELYVDIAIEPVKAVEFIYIPLRIKNTGEIAGL